MTTPHNYLVTGSNSGLGKFLKTRLQAIGLTREDKLHCLQTASTSFDVIIHCAYNVKRDITSSNLQRYIEDNMLLTRQLLDLPHQQFVFISSSDVYPQSASPWKENDDYLVQEINGLYGLSKLMTEKMVQSCGNLPLILRPTAMLGKDARPNSLFRMLYNEDVQLSLSSNSSFNYILHEDVLTFIQLCLSESRSGIYNLAARENITLEEVSTTFNRSVKFGSYKYQVANICNHKANAICDVFSHTSLQNIQRFQAIMEASSC